MGILNEEEEKLLTPCLPLLSLNHVSFVCKSVADSANFYQEVLGFVLIKRPTSFDFEGSWLFNYGIGIHLLQSNDIRKRPPFINPKDNHISFQCTDMELVKRKLAEMGMEYVSGVVEEGGIKLDHLFFHDPDGYMIEICNCDNLPVLPFSSRPLKPSYMASINGNSGLEKRMMEALATDMIHITL
ncbi:glyoxylase I 4-like [Magnolia sinica]|uniref:glyoxylase I 4-like n=1 Tax=Magnolia sinica TaxID=86752 RepID=UPI00265B681C|nr:glyoxylase I 4-like [Magnolia sinica]